MKCPECVANGQRSKVFHGMTSATLMMGQDFFDEDGRHHHHDPNSYSTSYSCSNGHKWAETRHPKCWCEEASVSKATTAADDGSQAAVDQSHTGAE